MSKHRDTTLFIVSSMPRFYQQLLAGVASYEALGNRIISRIRVAHAFRRTEQVRELARVLINIPIKEYQLIAQYYLVWCKCRDLEYHADILENIIEQTETYKAKALISRAAFEVYQGDVDRAMYFYTEALKPNPAISDFIKASTGIATLKSMEGYHASALKDLERLIPLLRYAEPLNYYEVINSYAVELAENNRLSEAHSASLLAISSPFGPYYPEWQGTLAEVRSKRKSRSTVAVGKSFTTDKPIAVDEFFDEPAEQPKARILAFPTQEPEEWKLEPELELEPEPEARATPGFSIEEFLFGEFNIRDKIEDWAHGVVDFDDLAMLSIALEECEDQAEKDLIISRLVDTVFTYSPEAKEAKEKWYDRFVSRIKPGD